MRTNPLRTLRDATGLNLGQIADQAGISEQAVIRNEQAVYTNPSQSLLDALWELAPESDLHDYGIFMADYHDFQRHTRQFHYGRLDPNFKFSSLQTGVHPFEEWRHDSDLSRIEISKFYCVHPALVFKFERQPWLCATPPKELLRALTDSGYTNPQLTCMVDAYTRYKDARKISNDGT